MDIGTIKWALLPSPPCENIEFHLNLNDLTSYRLQEILEFIKQYGHEEQYYKLLKIKTRHEPYKKVNKFTVNMSLIDAEAFTATGLGIVKYVNCAKVNLFPTNEKILVPEDLIAAYHRAYTKLLNLYHVNSKNKTRAGTKPAMASIPYIVNVHDRNIEAANQFFISRNINSY